jgi:biopolymer transport protein ExbB/TolQ
MSRLLKIVLQILLLFSISTAIYAADTVPPQAASDQLPQAAASEPSSGGPGLATGVAAPPEQGDVPAGLSEPAVNEASAPMVSSSLPDSPPDVDFSAHPKGRMSIKDMFLNADPVVQIVMLLLFLASVASWVIIFEKTFMLRKTSRSVMLFKRASAGSGRKAPDFPPLILSIVEAGTKESCDSAGKETRCDYRERVERSMRAEFSGLMDRVGHRVMFLATVGAVSPFVGLFGTVWGIMNSFAGIAASGETTLAVVAPGIAEALFATAMGLVAAIPAVIAYNKITGTMRKITKEALSGIGFLGNRLARRHFEEMEA